VLGEKSQPALGETEPEDVTPSATTLCGWFVTSSLRGAMLAMGFAVLNPSYGLRAAGIMPHVAASMGATASASSVRSHLRVWNNRLKGPLDL
jgi:hypothetical protein